MVKCILKIFPGRRAFLVMAILTAALAISCQKADEPGEGAPAAKAGKDLFVGQWDDTDDAATLDISVDEDGVYHGMGTWTRSSNEVTFWEFTGKADSGGIAIEGCERDDVTYDDVNGDEDVFLYEEATGRITNSGGTLKWTIDGDGDTADWVFEPAS